MKNQKQINFIFRWLLIFFAMSILAFFIIRITPVSPVTLYLEQKQLPQTQENIAFLEKKWGLDKPVVEQYFHFMFRFIKGDFGESMLTHLDIKDEMLARLPYSIAIGMGGVLLSAVFAFLLGYGAAVKNGGFCDYISKLLAIMTQTVPSFILGILILQLVTVKFRLVKIFTDDSLWGLIISMLIIALYQVGSLSRIVKVHFEKTKNETYIKSYITRGFSMSKILLKYGYHESLYGLLSAIEAKFSWVIGGTSIVEIIFAIRGVSTFVVDSVRARDYTVMQSYIILITIWMFCVHSILTFILRFLKRGKI